MIRVTKENYPALFAAFLLVELDNGAHHANRIFGEGAIDLNGFDVPDSHVNAVEPANAALQALRDTDKEYETEAFTTFVSGDQTEQESLVVSQPSLRIAHDLINDWFNGWEKD